MIEEAHLLRGEIRGDGGFWPTRLEKDKIGPAVPCGSHLISNCPFPPGYGPCSFDHHVHRIARAQNTANSSSAESYGDSDNALQSLKHDVIGGDRCCIDDGVQLQTEKGDRPLSDSEQCSTETLYRLTERAILLLPELNGNGEEPDREVIGVDTWVPGSCGKVASDTGDVGVIVEADNVVARGAIGGMDGCVRDEGCSDETASDETCYLINDEAINASIEEDNSAEFFASKETWHQAGLDFDSSDDEKLRAKLFRQKKFEGKKMADLRPKDQRQGKRPPCIQGRTLATRKLMSETALRCSNPQLSQLSKPITSSNNHRRPTPKHRSAVHPTAIADRAGTPSTQHPPSRHFLCLRHRRVRRLSPAASPSRVVVLASPSWPAALPSSPEGNGG
ncbi:hypothetical protein PIB30_008304 [Stylosanthes scabra]|uniref:Uncharacterized protein n=1 Tax=Stylosanthes scabra TaxID=79078 RepID=A0ABU6S525_9FABA|nr:hypothetical protein [Stylosanthes scabra]